MDFKELLKNKSVLGWGIAGLIFLLYLFALVLPLSIRLKNLSAQVSRGRAELAAARNTIARKEESAGKLARLKAELARVRESMLSEEETTLFLEHLFLRAEQAGVNILSADPLKWEGTEYDPWYTQVPVSLESRAGYHSLGLFLNGLEVSGSPLKVLGLDIKAGLETPYTHKVRLVVVALVLKSIQD